MEIFWHKNDIKNKQWIPEIVASVDGEEEVNIRETILKLAKNAGLSEVISADIK